MSEIVNEYVHKKPDRAAKQTLIYFSKQTTNIQWSSKLTKCGKRMGRVCAKSFEIEVIVIVKLNSVGLKAVSASCSFEILSHFA